MANEQMRQDVYEWVMKEGYPLEMRVCYALRRAGVLASQSDYYVDPETGKPREIDITGGYSHPVKRGKMSEAALNFAIECKRSLEPWVAFGEDPSIEVVGGGTVLAGAFPHNKTLAATYILDNLDPPLSIAAKPRHYAYGITSKHKVGKNEVDRAYAAVMSAGKASRAALDDFYASLTDPTSYFELNIPIVLLEGHLFHCYLKADTHEVEVAQVERLILGSSHPGIGAAFTAVHIVTEEALPALMQDMLDSVERLASAIDERYPDAT